MFRTAEHPLNSDRSENCACRQRCTVDSPYSRWFRPVTLVVGDVTVLTTGRDTLRRWSIQVPAPGAGVAQSFCQSSHVLLWLKSKPAADISCRPFLYPSPKSEPHLRAWLIFRGRLSDIKLWRPCPFGCTPTVATPFPAQKPGT